MRFIPLQLTVILLRRHKARHKMNGTTDNSSMVRTLYILHAQIIMIGTTSIRSLHLLRAQQYTTTSPITKAVAMAILPSVSTTKNNRNILFRSLKLGREAEQ